MSLKHNVNLKGWNSQAHRGFPGKFESSNVSRGNVSREIGRTLQINVLLDHSRETTGGHRSTCPVGICSFLLELNMYTSLESESELRMYICISIGI